MKVQLAGLIRVVAHRADLTLRQAITPAALPHQHRHALHRGQAHGLSDGGQDDRSYLMDSQVSVGVAAG